MSEEIGALLELVTAGEWGNNQGTPGGVDTGVIRSANFTKDHQFNTKEIVVRSIEERKRQKKLLRKGDILIEKSGGSPDQPVGRVLFYDLKGEHTCSNFISILRPSQHVEAKFLYYSLCNLYEKGVVKNYQQQTTGIINLQLGEYLRESIYFPPLPEQKKIAEILSGIDQCIYEQKNKIEIVTTILKNASSQLLDNISKDPSTNHKRIDEVSTLKGGNGFPIEHQGITHGGTPFIKVSDFNKPGNENEIKTANNYLSEESMSSLRPCIFPVNTIVFAKVGAALTSNRRRILSVPTCIDNNLMGAIPNDIEPLYLKLLFEKIDFNQFCQDGAVPSVNQSQIGSIEVPIPSTDKQKQVVLAIESFRATSKMLEAKKEKLVALKKSLSADLLSGRKRVSI